MANDKTNAVEAMEGAFKIGQSHNLGAQFNAARDKDGNIAYNFDGSIEDIAILITSFIADVKERDPKMFNEIIEKMTLVLPEVIDTTFNISGQSDPKEIVSRVGTKLQNYLGSKATMILTTNADANDIENDVPVISSFDLTSEHQMPLLAYSMLSAARQLADSDNLFKTTWDKYSER